MLAAVTTAIAALVTAVTGVLTTNLPVVIGFAGLLIGLGLAWRYVKKFIGRKA